METADSKALLRRLQLALALNASIVAAEFAVGIKINSVGLMTDAGHNCIDQGALFLTLYAHLLSLRPATAARTFGWHRAGIVTAFGNAILLLVTAAGLSIMALKRLLAPQPVQGAWVIGTALLSFAANMGIALALQKGSEHDLNIRGAFWHMLGDAWVSFGVAASGGAILLTHWYILDPLVSFVIIGVILSGAWPVLRESLEILLESAPGGLTSEQVARVIEEVPGVRNAHDLHLWTLKPGITILSCHVLAAEGAPTLELLKAVRSAVSRRCGIPHLTIQVETACCHPQAVHCDLDRLLSAHAAAVH